MEINTFLSSLSLRVRRYWKGGSPLQPPITKSKRTIESRAKRSSINLIRTHFQYACCFIHREKQENIYEESYALSLWYCQNIRVIRKVFTMKMEILLEPTSNKLLVGDMWDPSWIKLVTTGKKRWGDSHLNQTCSRKWIDGYFWKTFQCAHQQSFEHIDCENFQTKVFFTEMWLNL